MKKTIAFILCVLTLMSVLQLPLFAKSAEGVVPFSDSTVDATAILYIDANGKASATVKYTGYSSVTTGGTITTKLQKRFLGVFWKTVDDQVWVDSSSSYHYSVTHTYQLSDTGTYRIVANFQIAGVGGTVDEIERTAQDAW